MVKFTTCEFSERFLSGIRINIIAAQDYNLHQYRDHCCDSIAFRPHTPSCCLNRPKLGPYEQHGVQSLSRRQVRKPCTEHEPCSLADGEQLQQRSCIKCSPLHSDYGQSGERDVH